MYFLIFLIFIVHFVYLFVSFIINKPLLAQWIYFNSQTLYLSQTDFDSEGIWDFEKPN